MDEDALIEAPVHAPSVAPWHLNMSQVDNIAPARSSCHPSTWRIEHASPAPRTRVNPPAAFESTWQLEDELSMAQWPVAEHSSRRTTTDLQLAAETPLPSSQAPAPASPASPPSRQPSDQLSAHQLVELLLLQQAAGTAFPTPETTQVHPLAYPQPPAPPPHPSTLAPPLLWASEAALAGHATRCARQPGPSRRPLAPPPNLLPQSCCTPGHQVTPATPGPASSWGAADQALDSLVEQLQQLRARAAAQEQQQGRAWARVEQLEGLLAELQLLRAARQPPLLGSLTPRPGPAEADHSPAGSRVVLDPALPPGQAAQVAAEVQGAGGQLVAAQHMGAGATCMVTHSADAALAWLGRGMDLVAATTRTAPHLLRLSPDILRHLHRTLSLAPHPTPPGPAPDPPGPTSAASTCSGSLPGLPLPGCLTTSLAPIVKLEAAGGWEGAVPATAASTGGQLLPSSSKPGGSGEVDWSQLDSERGRKLLLLQLKAREEEGGATGRAGTSLTPCQAPLHLLPDITWAVTQAPSPLTVLRSQPTPGAHPSSPPPPLTAPAATKPGARSGCKAEPPGPVPCGFPPRPTAHDTAAARDQTPGEGGRWGNRGGAGDEEEEGAGEVGALLWEGGLGAQGLCHASSDWLQEEVFRASFVAGIPVRRSQLLGARCGWDGLVRCSRDQAMAVYELQLCM
ncbi:hypothetical protein QJQ45_016065 [Haematococcus lacustris]|nr:hypothetical protein QJQ45_016065 [Haematococcus lacustris]